MWNQLESQLEQQKKTLDDLEVKEKELKKNYKEVSEKRISIGLLIAEIGRVNNIDLDDNVNIKLDKIFQVILKSATYEILYKPNVSIRIIIKEYLNASNFFLNESQTKYLNAILDNTAKRLRHSNA